MKQKKTIVWESWNARVDEFLSEKKPPTIESEPEGYVESYEHPQEKDVLIPIINQPIYTPLGPFPQESLLKPSDRWDCWIANTNFPVKSKIVKILNKEIDGIECLKIMGKYTFFVGVAKLFDIKDVREQIDEKICSYTETEILSDEEVEQTVDLLKEQLKDNKYWSILVYPEGMVEYVVANEINIEYLDALNALIEKKNNFGGIILRSENE